MDQNRQKMTEKLEFREMRSFDLAIRRAYLKAQIRRNYAKKVVINRSVYMSVCFDHFMLDISEKC